MVSGFLGALISLERAVALDRPWAYTAPVSSGLGGLALIFGVTDPAGPVLITLGSLVFVIVSILIVRLHRVMYTATMGLGAISWLVGNIFWLAGYPISAFVSWWAAFLVLTIVGERLELSRIIRPSSYSLWLFAAAVALLLVGLLVSGFSLVSGIRIVGLAYIGLALWLVRFDVARRTVKRPGLTRFIAVNLLLGYIWLAISGLFGLGYAGVTAGFAYDAWLHALFLGFVFSMIFAHALIILPAVTGLAVPFNPILYGPVLFLQLGLVVRVAGDLTSWLPGKQWGGLLNAGAILWFILTVFVLVVSGRRTSQKDIAG
jgi:hypothetical protein